MLHLRWLLHQADPAPQRAILACGLVNERGQDTFKAIDLVHEHINLGFAQNMKMGKNSTNDVISTFIRGSLALAWGKKCDIGAFSISFNIGHVYLLNEMKLDYYSQHSGT